MGTEWAEFKSGEECGELRSREKRLFGGNESNKGEHTLIDAKNQELVLRHSSRKGLLIKGCLGRTDVETLTPVIRNPFASVLREKSRQVASKFEIAFSDHRAKTFFYHFLIPEIIRWRRWGWGGLPLKVKDLSLASLSRCGRMPLLHPL